MKFIKHSGSRTWQQVIKQKWWVNQQRAINCVENYLASNSDRQAMVRMPTGTSVAPDRCRRTTCISCL
jgi:hypothetical protein